MNALIGTKLGNELGKIFESILLIVVSGAVYYSTSRTILQSYITVRNAFIPIAKPKVPKNKFIRSLKYLGKLMISLLLFSLIKIVLGQDILSFDLLYSTLLFTPMVYATYSLFLSMSNSEKIALFESAKTGNVIVHLIDTSSSKLRKLRFILSGAIVAIAFSFNNSIALIVIYAAVITFFSWIFLHVIFPLRYTLYMVFLTLGVSFAFAGILTLIFSFSSTTPVEIESTWLFNLPADIGRWNRQIVTVEYAFLPLLIINTCLRFDYHNRSTTDDIIIVEKGILSSTSGSESKQVEKENTIIKKEGSNHIITVSPKIPLEFRKTYYTVSIASWLFIRLAMMPLGLPFSAQPLEFYAFETFETFASLVFMIGAVLAVAAIRKQLWDVWKFDGGIASAASAQVTGSKLGGTSASEDEGPGGSSIPNSDDGAVANDNNVDSVISSVTLEDNATQNEQV